MQRTPSYYDALNIRISILEAAGKAYNKGRKDASRDIRNIYSDLEKDGRKIADCRLNNIGLRRSVIGQFLQKEGAENFLARDGYVTKTARRIKRALSR